MGLKIYKGHFGNYGVKFYERINYEKRKKMIIIQLFGRIIDFP